MILLRVLVVLLTFDLIYGMTFDEDPAFCCFPDQWQALMLGSSAGPGSTDGFQYANGTVHFVYDYTNKRTYMRTEYIEYTTDSQSSPLNVNVTGIRDFKTNKQYQIFENVLCEHGVINQPFFKQCIPGNAHQLAPGVVGEPGALLPVQNLVFNISINTISYTLTAVVARSANAAGDCVPVHMTFRTGADDPSDVNVTGLDVLDFQATVTDPSVFTPPAICSRQMHTSPAPEMRWKTTRLLRNFNNMMHIL